MYDAVFILALIVLVFIGFVIGGEASFKRKMKVAMYTSILAVIVVNIVAPVPSGDGGWALGIFVYSTYIVPVTFIYGIITSVISEKISFKVKRYSTILSLVLHTLFGIVFILPYGILFESLPFTQLSISEIFFNDATLLFSIFAVMFFFIDYILKRGYRKTLFNDR